MLLEDNSLFEAAVDLIESCGYHPARNGTILFKTFDDQGRPSEDFWRLVKKNKNLFFRHLPLGYLKNRKESTIYLAFFDILRLLGVKKIVAYGGYIGLTTPDKDQQYDIDRCLGLFITYARINKMSVVISSNVIHRGTSREENKAKRIVYKDTDSNK